MKDTTRQLLPLEARLAASWPPKEWADVTVVLAVSGGADSVALLRAVAAIKTIASGLGNLVVAHVNHRLRGAEADGDEQFVRDLAGRLSIECTAVRLEDDLAQRTPDGLEAAARAARYTSLIDIAAEHGARYIVTAHTADDQAETILHRILRGTGVAGLAGIPRARAVGLATILRPMLGFRRAELLSYLADLGQEYRTDATNTDPAFTRSRIRHELLPQLAREYNAGIVGSLLRLGRLAGECQEVVEGLAARLLERAVEARNADRVELRCAPLASESPHIVRELLVALWREQGWPLQAMGLTEWDELAGMALGRPVCGGTDRPVPRKRVFPGGIVAESLEGRLVLSLPAPKAQEKGDPTARLGSPSL